ncbi:CAP domain-containing protein [Sulfitobacter sp. LCG007]
MKHVRLSATLLLIAALIPTLLPVRPALADASAVPAVNRMRESRGLAPLSYSRTLEAVARRHARDMSSNGFFSHTGSDGSNVAARSRAQGYRYCFVAENIAKGQKTLGAALQSWWDSRPHRRNIMTSRVREFAVVGTGDVWVMVLADPGC